MADVNYTQIRNAVDAFTSTRDGLSNSKDASMYNVFVGELTGILCGTAFNYNISTSDVLEYLNIVVKHKMKPINDDGLMHQVNELIDESILQHPLYNLLEYSLMYYKPGSTQVGPGELFFCFYDRDSTFGIDNTNGFDIIVDDKKTELKKVGSNFTDAELFDKYSNDVNCERLMVVKPISNAKTPKLRSSYACITFTERNWREAFEHKGKQGTLAVKGTTI